MKKTFAVVLVILLGCINVFAQNAVTGKVLDENGQPMIGAGVLVQGSNRGVITDLDGQYSITLQSGEGVLVFSYLGYTDQSVVVGDRTVIDVTLLPDVSNALNDVVVIGYGNDCLSQSWPCL